MAATIADIKSTLNNNSVPDSVVTLGLNDAAVFLITYGVLTTDPHYDILQRLYACHLLYIRGVSRVTNSESVGDVSASYVSGFIEDGAGNSPYLDQFFALLDRGKIVSSP